MYDVMFIYNLEPGVLSSTFTQCHLGHLLSNTYPKLQEGVWPALKVISCTHHSWRDGLWLSPRIFFCTVVRNMGANVCEAAIICASRSIGIVDEVCRCFEESLNVHQTAGSHDIPSDSRDFKVILETLLEKEVFADKGRRSHSQFKRNCTLMEQVDLILRMLCVR